MDLNKIVKEAKLDDTKIFTARVKAETLRQFREACKKNGSNGNRTVEAFMEQYIDETRRKK